MSEAPIITLAREAGADVHHGSMGKTLHVLFSRSQLERFAALVAAATGWTGKSNEHARDAAMVAWPYRGAGHQLLRSASSGV